MRKVWSNLTPAVKQLIKGHNFDTTLKAVPQKYYLILTVANAYSANSLLNSINGRFNPILNAFDEGLSFLPNHTFIKMLQKIKG